MRAFIHVFHGQVHACKWLQLFTLYWCLLTMWDVIYKWHQWHFSKKSCTKNVVEIPPFLIPFHYPFDIKSVPAESTVFVWVSYSICQRRNWIGSKIMSALWESEAFQCLQSGKKKNHLLDCTVLHSQIWNPSALEVEHVTPAKTVYCARLR